VVAHVASRLIPHLLDVDLLGVEVALMSKDTHEAEECSEKPADDSLQYAPQLTPRPSTDQQ